MNGVAPRPASRESSLSLSPVPSPRSHPYLSDTIVLATNPAPYNDNSKEVAAASATQNAKNTNAANPDKPKRPRKKKEPDTEDSKDEKIKEKKPRKPRASNPDGAAARKKQKTEAAAAVASSPATMPSRQATLSDMMNPMPPAPVSSLAASMAPVTKSPIVTQIAAPQPRPISSGQRYDPVRGMMSDPAPAQRSISSSSPQMPAHTSPSLVSLINGSSPTDRIKLVQPQAAGPATTSNQATTSRPSVIESGRISISQAPPSELPSTRVPVVVPTPMDVDAPPRRNPLLDFADSKAEDKAQSKSSSAVATPKEERLPPRPTGSGLLSSSDLFGGPDAGKKSSTRRGVDINIEIKLDPSGGNTINIAQEIMKRYGLDAINPRAAARRERLAEVAAAANKLERSSDEISVDMSVDGGSDKEDSNGEMMIDDQSTAGEGFDGEQAGKRKRRKKVEDYDKEDDFIDDTELAWEESAAVAKDGFFVYSGPLVKPEEKANVERAGAATRGRGRGRGRGGRAGAAAGTTHATSAAKTAEESKATPATAGRGRGGTRVRGTTARKPKVPKDKPDLAQSMAVEAKKPLAMAVQ